MGAPSPAAPEPVDDPDDLDDDSVPDGDNDAELSDGPDADPSGPDADLDDEDDLDAGDGAAGTAASTDAPRKRRRRGSRGGRNRNRHRSEAGLGDDPAQASDPIDDGETVDLRVVAGPDDALAGGPPIGAGAAAAAGASAAAGTSAGAATGSDPGGEASTSPLAPPPPARAAATPSPAPEAGGGEPAVPAPLPPVDAVARRPRIGDTRPAPPPKVEPEGAGEGPRRRRRRGSRGRGGDTDANGHSRGGEPASRGEPVRGKAGREPVEMLTGEPLAETDPETLERRRGRERKGRPVGRYLMCVHSQPHATQIAVLEGRLLIEHYVSRPQDDANQIDGNIYYGRVQNVLPGMEAAFVDIGTPKNAVLYRGDVRYDAEDVEGPQVKSTARIEQLLKPGQMIVCQVTKNPIAHKGARLTQEVSLPGRFVVFIPNSSTYGISKRLSDDERKRLRRILDDVKPANHGLIVRTAAEGASADELRRDVARLAAQWDRIDALARRTKGAGLLYREPDIAVRVIREEFNKEYRGVVIDNRELYEDVRDYVASISPELADRVEFYDEADEGLPVFERFHIHEQLHKAIDRKVWLPSGGSLIIERTEALTVIDVNTGKNVGTSNLEETVYRNNLEAAEEIARQLRLRDIGGIIVIDFIDMEISGNRADVVRAFRDALARDKTRSQVFDISELGLVEMTRKRVSEGLVESLSATCPTCEGRGIIFDPELFS